MGILSGVKVVEFTHMVAGPACGMILGDFGARVIKVEPPQGDITRRIGPRVNGTGALYASTNRNKEIVTLDLNDATEADDAVELAMSADVVVTNLDVALLKRAHLDATTLRERNPALIVVTITGFGPGGPAGTDGLAQAAMGMMEATGPVEGPGYRTGPSIVDVSTGTWAALGVLAALENRRQTGMGDEIRSSLADACLYLQYPHVTMHDASPATVRRNGNHSVVSCTPMFQASDGRFMATILHDRHWQIFCTAIGAPELFEDAMFDSNEKRCELQNELEARVDPMTRKRTRTEWVERLRAERLPCAPERSYAEVESDRTLYEREMLYRLPENGGSLQVAMPLEFSTLKISAPRPPAHPSRPLRAGQ
ncbi:hypothetical protein CSC94_22455 [Zhengella mangrovi]|uniref:CoA transferase n=1 Tax=Zhengella mangrovi TaxID=1982044 RepID=A0A2G1QH17_9HYPH|nr:CoA transferase [Zhengella mangrovi]PHP64837.1 hypothetical protein CSC94_22455 [Zhengella mangrovi]